MGGSASKTPYLDKLMTKIPSLQGKVIAITGCTSGTGLAAAVVLVQKGAHVVMLNRPSARAEAALKQVAATERADKKFEEDKEGLPKASHYDLDLMDFGSVRQCADQLLSDFKLTGIDVLINNAGVMACPDKATVDGCDVQMQTNHLSHFLLTKRLFPLLKTGSARAGEARVVNHSSIAREGKNLEAKYLEKNGGNLGGDSSWMVMRSPPWVRYQQSKLANCVFTAALQDRCSKAGLAIKSVVAHPGVAKTALPTNTAKQGFGIFSLWDKVAFGQSAEDGACGIISCAVLPQVESGDFYGPGPQGFTGDAVKIPPEELYNNQKAKDVLWHCSVQSTGEDFEF